jgi:hypothetical protein
MKRCGTCRFWVKGTLKRGRCTKTDQDKWRLDEACPQHGGRSHMKKKDVTVITLTGEQVTLREMRRRKV